MPATHRRAEAERPRVGKFLPVSGKPVFSAVKTGLAKIVFAGKNSFCQ